MGRSRTVIYIIENIKGKWYPNNATVFPDNATVFPDKYTMFPVNLTL